MISRFQGTGPNIKHFKKGLLYIASYEKLLLVKIYFIWLSKNSYKLNSLFFIKNIHNTKTEKKFLKIVNIASVTYM